MARMKSENDVYIDYIVPEEYSKIEEIIYGNLDAKSTYYNTDIFDDFCMKVDIAGEKRCGEYITISQKKIDKDKYNWKDFIFQEGTFLGKEWGKGRVYRIGDIKKTGCEMKKIFQTPMFFILLVNDCFFDKQNDIYAVSEQKFVTDKYFDGFWELVRRAIIAYEKEESEVEYSQQELEEIYSVFFGTDYIPLDVRKNKNNEDKNMEMTLDTDIEKQFLNSIEKEIFDNAQYTEEENERILRQELKSEKKRLAEHQALENIVKRIVAEIMMKEKKIERQVTEYQKGKVFRYLKYLEPLMLGIHDYIDILPTSTKYNIWEKDSFEKIYDSSIDLKLWKGYRGIYRYLLNKRMKECVVVDSCFISEYILFCVCVLSKINCNSFNKRDTNNDMVLYSFERTFSFLLFFYEAEIILSKFIELCDELEISLKGEQDSSDSKCEDLGMVLLKSMSVNAYIDIYREIYNFSGVFGRLSLAESILPEFLDCFQIVLKSKSQFAISIDTEKRDIIYKKIFATKTHNEYVEEQLCYDYLSRKRSDDEWKSKRKRSRSYEILKKNYENWFKIISDKKDKRILEKVARQIQDVGVGKDDGNNCLCRYRKEILKRVIRSSITVSNILIDE